MMTVLVSVPIKRDHTTPITSMSDGIYDNLTMERPRKYSESYREIEEVDSHRQEPSEQAALVSTSSSCCPKLLSTLEEESRESSCCKVQQDSTSKWIHDGTCNNAGTSVSTISWEDRATIDCDNARPLRHSQSFLDSIPVATASPETTTTPMETVSAVATNVMRLKSNKAPCYRNACLINVKIFKSTQDLKLGIRLQVSKEGTLQIGRVAGFLADSPLRSGDEVLRLNGQDVSAWTTTKALNYLREAWGWISIVVRNTHATADPSICLASVCKRSPSDKLGVSFERQDDNSPLTVRGLNVAGLLGGRTTIRTGDVVESINQIPSTSMDNQEAISIIRSLSDWVHILVRTKPDIWQGLHNPLNVTAPEVQVTSCKTEEVDFLNTMQATEVLHPLELDDRDDLIEPSLLSLTMYKMQKTDKLGLSLIKLDDAIYINRISGTGHLAGSILKEGMALLSINQKLTSRMTLSEATSYLRDRVGSITFLAKNPHGNPKYVQAMAYKKCSESTNESPVGISFKGSIGRQLKVCEIRGDGLFVESCLNVGDSILRVNDTPCRHSRPKDVVDLIRSSHETVSILAKSKTKTAIVVAQIASRGTPSRSNFVASRSA